MIWAKSWHTPRRFSKPRRAASRSRVAFGSYLKSARMRLHQFDRAVEDRAARRKALRARNRSPAASAARAGSETENAPANAALETRARRPARARLPRPGVSAACGGRGRRRRRATATSMRSSRCAVSIVDRADAIAEEIGALVRSRRRAARSRFAARARAARRRSRGISRSEQSREGDRRCHMHRSVDVADVVDHARPVELFGRARVGALQEIARGDGVGEGEQALLERRACSGRRARPRASAISASPSCDAQPLRRLQHAVLAQRRQRRQMARRCARPGRRPSADCTDRATTMSRTGASATPIR